MFKEIVDGRTMDADNGPSQKLTLSTLWSGELKSRFISHANKVFGKLQQTNSNVIIWIYV